MGREYKYTTTPVRCQSLVARVAVDNIEASIFQFLVDSSVVHHGGDGGHQHEKHVAALEILLSSPFPMPCSARG